MKDDLISRKALIENLNRFAPEHYTSLVNDLIMKQPTAFDTKKVMEEMHDSAELIVERGEWYVPLHVALEIAEKGGVR